VTAELLSPPDTSEQSSDGGSTDRLFGRLMAIAALSVIAVLVATAIFLLIRAWPALSHYGPLSFFHARWAPSEAAATSSEPNPYGILQFVYGTVVTSLVAMVITVPVAIAVALYITNLSPAVLRRPLSSLVDLLAAIPSVVFGFWGVFALMPALGPIGRGLTSVADIPVIGWLFQGPFFGYSVFAAGVVLAIMVLPIVTAICREVFDTAPRAEKEAALGVGATTWEMLRIAVLPRSRSGIVGAAILGLGRAFGETIAVTMLIGNNVLTIPKGIMRAGSTMPSVIANEFTEANQPFHLDSLFVVAFALLLLSLLVNILGKRIVGQVSEHLA
jgi:phosphate transport system permease protein